MDIRRLWRRLFEIFSYFKCESSIILLNNAKVLIFGEYVNNLLTFLLVNEKNIKKPLNGGFLPLALFSIAVVACCRYDDMVNTLTNNVLNGLLHRK